MRWQMGIWRRRKDKELEQEIRGHLEMAAKAREERGEGKREAEQAARGEVCNGGLAKEVTRGVWGLRRLEKLMSDLRYGARKQRQNSGFTAVAGLTVALG